MKIIELNIVEFGCLKDKKITLGDGLNTLCGDNESGKSTVLLFIRFMLYGLPKKSTKNHDRERCLSFDGHRAAGSMLIEHGGKQYRIERRAVGTGKVSEVSSFTCVQTGEVFTADAGEALLGVPCEVFESSCCTGQMKATEISKSHTSSAIENIMVSADESIDANKILERLDRVRKEYKLNKGEGGRLFDTELRIAELRVKKDEATEKHLRYNEMLTRFEKKQAETEGVKRELDAAESAIKRIRDAQTLERFERLERNRNELENTKRQLASLEKSFARTDFLPSESHASSLRSALASLKEAVAKEAQRKAEYDAAVASDSIDESLALVGERIEAEGGKEKISLCASCANKKSRALRALGIVSGIGAVAGVVLAVVLTYFAAIAAAVLGIVCALLLVGSAKAKKQRDSICQEYGKSYSELDVFLGVCLEQLSKKRQLEGKLIAARAILDFAAEDARRSKESLISLLCLTCPDECDDVTELYVRVELEARRIDEFCALRAETSKRIYALSTLCESETAALRDYDEAALRASVGEPLPATDAQSVASAETTLRFNKTKWESLTREISRLTEALAGAKAGLGGDPVAIADKICELEQKLRRDSEYFDALMLAKKSIEQASVSISGNVTPEISRRAGEMLSLISGGKHVSVQTTKNLDLSVVENDGFNVRAELLSGGARDAAYICLRISLMLRLFGDDMPPLLLDEALCQLDDGRVKAMLSLLDKLSEQMGLQTLLFSCHSREHTLCEQMNIHNTCVHI